MAKHDRRWDEKFAYAEKIYAEKGSDWWKGITVSDPSFARWLLVQRKRRREGTLRADRAGRLEKIGFEWEPHEAMWQESFADLQAYMAEAGDAWWRSLPKDDEPLSVWCMKQRSARTKGQLPDGRIAALERVGFVWRPLQERWEQRFQEVKGYLENSPVGRIPKGGAPRDLLAWVLKQRSLYSTGEIPEDRRRRLDEIFFRWDGREAKSDDIWEQHFGDLAVFHRMTGGPDVSPEENLQTFNWLQRQRAKWDDLPADRRARLEALGVTRPTPSDRVVHPPFVPDWDKFFAQAREFRAIHGHLHVVSGDGPTAFSMLEKMAGMIRNGSLEPSGEQRAELVRLGFEWDLSTARAERFFDQRFAELVEFKNEFGHTNVSQISKTHPHLGQWVNRTRMARWDLTESQRQRLDDLGFVWELKKQWMANQWEIRFAELVEYKKKHGDCLVPQPAGKHSTLSLWVSRTRTGRDKLSAERIRRLEEIGFVWDPKAEERAATEAERLAEFEAFVKVHGHARVTRGNDPTGGVLNRWMVRLREKKNKGVGPINQELVERLDALGFLWVVPR
ncbi:hypothetical protein BH23VER1_BH23VER1_35730 [soil metagenome]